MTSESDTVTIKKVRKSSLRMRFKKYFWLYILALPGAVYMIINNYFPMVGLSLAFKKFSFAMGIFRSPWSGFDNFSYLFTSKWAKIMFRNTIGYNLVFLALGTVFSIFVAILLGEIQSAKAKQTYQTLILIPHLISMVLVGYLVYALLATNTGFLNKKLVEPLGGPEINWYMEKRYWPLILTIVNLWKGFGFQSIIYYATIIGFDKSYYESAVVDGANVWQQITKITLPLLRPTVIILTIMALGRMFASDFGLFYQVPLDTPTLYTVTTTIDTYVFRVLMDEHDPGRALSAGFLQSILGFILVMTTNAIVRKIEPESALF